MALDPADSSRAPDGQPYLQSRVAIIFISVVLLVLLIPFIGSAFRIDDPLFIWAARHIQNNPSNPYGFSVNWYGAPMLMSVVTKNPPLACYYIALAASLLGWSETALHLAFMLPALGVGLGTFLLARRLCAKPLLATLMAVLTPVFFVSSITVMSDMMMLAFWVFGVYFWITGLESGNQVALGVAGILIAVSALTKYFGMTLIPLLLVYSIFKQRRIGWWLSYFLIPTAMLAWYQWITRRLYGRGLLLDAAAYASGVQGQFGRLSIAKMIVALAFTGGCVASALFFARQLWSRKTALIGVVVAVVITVIISASTALGSFSLPPDEAERMLIAVQLGIWTTIGVSIITIAVLDFHGKRDADSLLLLLWMVGTFIFAGFINWTTNGRSILPMLVPAGILIARRLESRARASRRKRPVTLIPLGAAMIVSLAVTYADCRFANTARVAAATIREKYPNARVSFQGHWGFQYYMEQLGMKAVDVQHPELATGDIVVVPTTNTNIYPMPRDWTKVRDTVTVPSSGWLATMNSHVGAGFYADVFGPLPFAAGSIPSEQFTVYQVVAPTAK